MPESSSGKMRRCLSSSTECWSLAETESIKNIEWGCRRKTLRRLSWLPDFRISDYESTSVKDIPASKGSSNMNPDMTEETQAPSN